MHFSPPFFCRIHGYYFAQMSFADRLSLKTLLFFAQTMLLLLLLPTVFCWLYRTRRWKSLAVGVVGFLLGVDHLMLTDRGSMGQTFAGTMILFGALYAVVVIWMETSRRLGRHIRAGATTLLPASDRLALAGLTVLGYLFFFFSASALNVPDSQALNATAAFVNCLFQLPQPVNLLSWSDMLSMLLAIPPTLSLTVVLHAWFCRRIHQSRRPPWLVYVAAAPGLGCCLLVAGLLIMQRQVLH